MKKIKILLIALILILGGVFFGNTYAADRSLKAELNRYFTNSKYQYTVPDNIKYTVVKIHDTADSLYNKALYCLRGGKGFGSNVQENGTDISTDPITYTELGEMHSNAGKIEYNDDKTVKEKNGVIGKYYELYGVDLNRNETINSKDVNIYNAILWILDESYLPADKLNNDNTKKYDEVKYKKELLDKAGIPTSEQDDITKDDIEVIQQLAVWYFVNYDEQKAGIKPTVSQNTKFPAQFLSINDNNNIDSQREENLNRLYQYLIYGAIDNATIYVIDEATGARTKVIEKNEFDKTSSLIITSVNVSTRFEEVGPASYYKIGPVKIKSDINDRTGSKVVDTTSIVLYDAEGNAIPKFFEIKEEDQVTGEIVSGGFHPIYEFIDEATGSPVTQLQKGVSYHIKFMKAFEKGSTVIPYIQESDQYDVSKVNLKMTSSYTLSKATFLHKENTDQAIVEIDKDIIDDPDEITTEDPGKFDLSLRKFITAINGTELTGENSRVPKIDLSKLNTIDARTNKEITTAIYVHPKNKLNLKRGDIITYTIRVYNEGDLDGYATEVKDYLPEGLELVEGQNDIWTASGNTLTTTVLSDKKIPGYNKEITSEENADKTDGVKWQKAEEGKGESGLYYYDLTVVCKIKNDVQDGITLTNIAEITADKSEPTDIDDRDSQPNNFPDEMKNNNYEGNENEGGYVKGQQDDDDFERVTVEPNEVFDLALRKYIVAVEENTLEGDSSRIPDIDKTPLTSGRTTANYKHKKDPVEVEIGNTVTYRFSVYNEGDIDGEVYSIVDYLPAGLTFDAESNSNFIEYKETYTEEEKAGKQYAYKIEGNKITITSVNGNKLFELSAFDGTELDSESIDVKFKVTVSESNDDQILTNVATMTYGPKGVEQSDRDSSAEEFTVPSAEKLLEGLPGYKGKDENKDDLTDKTYHYEGQQDDDDFEKVIIKGKPFDLSLRKFITSIKRNGEEVSFADRTPQIDTTTLINGTFDRNGNKEYTATYEHSKEPLTVKKGDIITYTLRVYNEGERDGYASEITDYIPEGLALIKDYKTNYNNEWRLPQNLEATQTMKLVGEKGFYKTSEDAKNFKVDDFEGITDLSQVDLVTGKVAITTTELDGELLKAFDKNLTQDTAGEGWQKADNGEGGLYYKDIQVSCLVIAENTYKGTITNVTEISEDKDKYGNDVVDRDSVPNDKQDPYTTWQEDDDDYEPVVLRYFDLALRKFITGVETNGKTENITSRIPAVSIDEETGNIKYTHPKEEAPVKVANNDVVIYTLRVYNEGTLEGYAEEITDDIPEGLIYLPDHDINKQYKWKMVDKDGKVTDKLDEAQCIKTEYLSKANGETENLLKPFDSDKAISTEAPLNPDYRDVKVAFKVTEPNTSDRVIVNKAQISEDSNFDEDSDPHEWIEGEDDQDREYIYVKYFDLSLLKWVTKTVVTVDGKTTTTETGFKPNTGKTETTGIRDNKANEPVAKVELDRKKLSRTTVKFVYKIRITNEGEIAGYATEITDFIPKGLEFKAEDNKKYGWVKEGTDKVTTRALETTLLQPGQSAEVEIVFTWKNDKNNLGLKTNIAEITEDYNEYNSKDIDSTPNNKQNPYEKEQEDDDDFALVILSLKTGKAMSYTLLTTTVVAILAGGIYLIKKYVLR